MEPEVWVTLMDRAPQCELLLDEWAAAASFVRQRAEVFNSSGAFGLYRHRMTMFDRVVQQDEASTCHIFTQLDCSPEEAKAMIVPRSSTHRPVCWKWQRNGSCRYGESCRFEHAEQGDGHSGSGIAVPSPPSRPSSLHQ
jgi:hypothetical protein